MDKRDICEKVNTILGKVLEDISVPDGNDVDFSDRMNSIEFVTLLISIENEFDIEIDDDDFDMEKLSSVNKIADLVISYKEKN